MYLGFLLLLRCSHNARLANRSKRQCEVASRVSKMIASSECSAFKQPSTPTSIIVHVHPILPRDTHYFTQLHCMSRDVLSIDQAFHEFQLMTRITPQTLYAKPHCLVKMRRHANIKCSYKATHVVPPCSPPHTYYQTYSLTQLHYARTCIHTHTHRYH